MASQKEKILESAQRFINRGQIDRAIRDYQQVVAMDPRDNRYRQKLAELLVRVGRQEEAVEQFEDIAHNYSQNSYYLKAIAVYKQIQRLVPKDTRISLTLAELNHKQGLVGNALAEYGQVVGALEQEGNLKKAIEVLEQMISIDGQNLTTRLKHAELLRQTGDDERAFSAFSDILHALQLRGDVAGAQKFEQRLNLMYPGKTKQGGEGRGGLNLEWGEPAATKGASGAAAQPAEKPEPPAELPLSFEEDLAEHHSIASTGSPVAAGPDLELTLDAEGHLPAASSPPTEELPGLLQEVPSAFPVSPVEEEIGTASIAGAPTTGTAESYWEVEIEIDFDEEGEDPEAEPATASSLPVTDAATEATADPIMPRQGEPLSVEAPEDLHQEDGLDWLDLVDFDAECPVVVASPLEAAGPSSAGLPIEPSFSAESAAVQTATPPVAPVLEPPPEVPWEAQSRSLAWDDIFPEWGAPAADTDLGELESHYDLGLAYREMGMFREAIKELSEAGRNPRRRLDSLTFQALCYRDLGDTETAEELLKKGRALEGISVEERMWLGYELAELCEQAGENDEAVELYQEVYSWDAGFQDVAQRLGRLTGEEKPAEIELAEEF